MEIFIHSFIHSLVPSFIAIANCPSKKCDGLYVLLVALLVGFSFFTHYTRASCEVIGLSQRMGGSDGCGWFN